MVTVSHILFSPVIAQIWETVFSRVWSAFLVVIFFGGSIFVHELGHFLAARRRGVLVERFSIGFGPAIWSHLGRDGTRYQVSWFPLGGYVLLPQLADIRAIEGESATNAPSLPAVTYLTKIIVFTAGVTFNLIFAFLLACILCWMGVPENADNATTEIGAVSRVLEISKGVEVPSPASQAGLRAGDIVRTIDGQAISDWNQLMQALAFGSGRDSQGGPQTVFTIERDGVRQEVTLHPRLSGDENYRRVGIAPKQTLIVHDVVPDSAGARAGFRAEDILTELDGVPTRSLVTCEEILAGSPMKAVAAVVQRKGKRIDLTIPPRVNAKGGINIGLSFTVPIIITHPSPFAQIGDQVKSSLSTVKSLLNPHSDIGPSKLTGPVGIIRIFHTAAEAGMGSVLGFTILLNVSLAIFNLMPFPPLDGSQIVFATIARLRGRSLAPSFIAALQGVFIMLFVSLFLYVFVFDMRRWMRDAAEDRAVEAATAATAAPGK